MTRNAAIGVEISRLWRKHLHAPFPARLRDEEVGGVDLAGTQEDVAGCLAAWRAEGTLDEAGRKGLDRAVEEIDVALPLLTSRAEALYVDRLRTVARLLLDA